MRMGIVAVFMFAVVAAADPPPDAARERTPYDYRPMLEFAGEGVTYPDEDTLVKLAPIWPTVPWHLNAAYYYARAARLARAMEKKHAPPRLSGMSEPSHAGDEDGLQGWIQAQEPAFKEWVAMHRPALAAMQQGLPLRTCALPLLLGKVTSDARMEDRLGTPLVVFLNLRVLTHCCTDAAFLDELEGRPDAAVEPLLNALRMTAHLAECGDRTQQIAAVSLTDIVLDKLNRLTAHHALPKRALRRIIAECRAAQLPPDVMARTWAANAAVREATSPHVGWTKMHADIAAVMMQPFAELFTDGGPAAQINRTLPEGSIGAYMLRNVGPSMQRLAVHLGRMEFLVRATKTRAAIRLYAHAHGGQPATLDALVPAFLPVVPEDPFTGEPLKYAVDAKGTWRVWSVGEDLKDDGGKAPADARAIYSTGPDYVMPSALRSNARMRMVK